MSADAPTEAEAQPTLEEAAAARVAEQQEARTQVEVAELRKSFGGTDEGMAIGTQRAINARARLGITEEAVTRATNGNTRKERELVQDAAELGEAFETLPADMTPAQARERRDVLMKDRDHFNQLRSGDRRTLLEWRALNWLASIEK